MTDFVGHARLALIALIAIAITVTPCTAESSRDSDWIAAMDRVIGRFGPADAPESGPGDELLLTGPRVGNRRQTLAWAVVLISVGGVVATLVAVVAKRMRASVTPEATEAPNDTGAPSGSAVGGTSGERQLDPIQSLIESGQTEGVPGLLCERIVRYLEIRGVAPRGASLTMRQIHAMSLPDVALASTVRMVFAAAEQDTFAHRPAGESECRDLLRRVTAVVEPGE